MERLCMAKISINEVTIDGVEYRKVDDEARVGDYVDFASAPFWYLSARKMYEVNRIDGAGDPHITDDDGDDFDLYGEKYDVFRKVATEKYREVKRPAKVGERIRIVNPILAFRKYKA